MGLIDVRDIQAQHIDAKLHRKMLVGKSHKTGTPVQLVEFLKQSACMSQAEAAAALKNIDMEALALEEIIKQALKKMVK